MHKNGDSIISISLPQVCHVLNLKSSSQLPDNIDVGMFALWGTNFVKESWGSLGSQMTSLLYSSRFLHVRSLGGTSFQYNAPTEDWLISRKP